VSLAYLDSSAFLKLIIVEPESDALASWLADWPERVSSMLLGVEARRAVLRQDASAVRRLREATARLYLAPITESLLDAAGRLEPAQLRTLDAIHLATALSLIARVGVVVTYDRRMIEAAEHLGLSVASPV
jgi:uncharacterized protein